ncbi:hypothetical protein [Pseudomonas sp. dw_358]|uniref:hypothetical protein n=1 Tax=Pseudomonas sp. dw_358 TaxID=2720083 RepID=UPI001BD2486C|nr:hypothetical protein [Pseudomonas sp. dw_358]
MTPATASVTDLVLYRKRKQAQELGRALWAHYATGGALPTAQWIQAIKDDASRQA